MSASPPIWPQRVIEIGVCLVISTTFSANVQAKTGAKPEQIVRSLFAAIERGDEAAIQSLVLPGGNITEQEVPSASEPCRFNACTDSMTVEDFSSGVAILAPLKADFSDCDVPLHFARNRWWCPRYFQMRRCNFHFGHDSGPLENLRIHIY